MNPVPDAASAPGEIHADLPQAYTYIDPGRRSGIAEKPPRVVFIEVTNQCNLLCETCPRTFDATEEPQTLTRETFSRIVEQFPDMQRAMLHGIGEPLMNEDLPHMIADLKKRDITVIFNTNATLLDEEWGRALIDSQLDEMRCSMDAANPSTYVSIRGAPLWHGIVHNLEQFARLRQRLGADKPRVSLWMTAMRENITELPELVRLAARLDVPEVYVHRMVYYLDSQSPPGMMDRKHTLSDGFDETVDRVIAEAELTARELGISLRASGATDPRRSLKDWQNSDPQPWTMCLRPWTAAYVTANGNCLPCCISPFATLDYESLKMGNLLEQDFSQIWNNERYQAWRALLLSETPSMPCRGCGTQWSL